MGTRMPSGAVFPTHSVGGHRSLYMYRTSRRLILLSSLCDTVGGLVSALYNRRHWPKQRRGHHWSSSSFLNGRRLCTVIGRIATSDDYTSWAREWRLCTPVSYQCVGIQHSFRMTSLFLTNSRTSALTVKLWSLNGREKYVAIKIKLFDLGENNLCALLAI